MNVLTDAQALDAFVDAITPRLVVRGFVIGQDPTPAALTYVADYDDATCVEFLSPVHLGDTVLERAAIFFGLLEQDGEVASPDLVDALGVKGATSLPANLTNPLKKRARRMGIPVPWRETATPDGLRTIWVDRDGIAARMVEAIDDERKRRGLI